MGVQSEEFEFLRGGGDVVDGAIEIPHVAVAHPDVVRQKDSRRIAHKPGSIFH